MSNPFSPDMLLSGVETVRPNPVIAVNMEGEGPEQQILVTGAMWRLYGHFVSKTSFDPTLAKDVKVLGRALEDPESIVGATLADSGVCMVATKQLHPQLALELIDSNEEKKLFCGQCALSKTCSFSALTK